MSRGAPLFEYDNIELGEAIGDYRSELAELRKDRAHLEYAQRLLERGRLLIEKEAIAKKEIHVREAEYGAAEAAVDNRHARIARAKEKLVRFGMTAQQIEGLSSNPEGALPRDTSYTIVRAPTAGVVTAREGAPGEVVGPEKTVVSIADLSSVWTLIDVHEKDVAQVRRGAPVEITVETYPDETFRGTIAYVADLLDPETRTAKVRVEIPNALRKLKPGMFATARLRIQAASPTTVLAIPSSAIQQVENQPVVFVKKDAMTFERRRVKLGITTGDLVEVTEGLKSDEEVVTAGSFTLKSELLKGELGGPD